MDGGHASRLVSEAAPPIGGPRRVLIVEDELLIALGAEMALTDADHIVLGTATAEDEAVEMALRERPDLILLDLKLARGGSGRRVAERLQGQITVAIIFASGNLTPEVRAALAELAPVAMISKPYFDAQLLGAVAAVETQR